MNDDNRVNAQTRLFGFLGEYAQQDRFSTTMNRRFRDSGVDAMCVPMNIRADDFYFTVSGLRNAQLSGVVIAPEYRHDVVEMLDGCSEAVSACGFCDIITVKEGKLYGDIMIAHALAEAVAANNVRTLAVLGSGALAASLLRALQHGSVENVTLFNDRIESCMTLMQRIGLDDISVDIERCNADIAADLSRFDAAINAADQALLFCQLTCAPLMIDLAHQNSPFQCADTVNYLGYDALLPFINDAAYTLWFEGKE